MRLRKQFFTFLFTIASPTLFAQPNLVKQIDALNTPGQALAPLLFLASDELMGRSTTRPEINIAARYISEQFRSFGLKEVPGSTGHFQQFQLQFITAPTAGILSIGSKTYSIEKDLLQVKGQALQLTAPVVFAGFGNEADITNLDIKGKIVVVNMGENDSTLVIASRRSRDAKQKRLQEKGAIAMIERYWQPAADWEMLEHAYSGQRSPDVSDSLLPVFLVYDAAKELPALLKNVSSASLQVSGNHLINVAAKNVLGWVEGTDPVLKNQFIVLSAHYDHIGVAAVPKMENGKLDSVYNGARDNAVGVTAVINAAKYFAQHPARRSILFIAFTGEEMGLLGSKYFAAHPVIDLNKIVYNLNIDNGGYNDTTHVNVIGLGRTSADDYMKRAAAAYGMQAGPDPAPQLNLFDRSDNVSFAAQGIPAPSFGMGVSKLDESIMQHYHQLSDEVDDMDLAYMVKYMKAYILAAKYIADNSKQPMWIKGDKYEAAWKKLYSK